AGRLFNAGDDTTPNANPLAVLSYNFWNTRFGGDRSILNKTMVLNGHNMTIIGVAQRGFNGVELGYSTQVFVPVMMKAWMTPGWDDALTERRSSWVNVFGRLKPGITPKQAQAALQPYFHQLLNMEVREAAFRRASPYVKQEFLKATLEVLPGSQGRTYLQKQLSSPLIVLMAIVGFVLLIACANVANLLLARATARQKEIAVRLALGAGRARLVRQLLVESLLLAGAGGIAGLLLAIWTDRLLLTFVPHGLSGLRISSTPDLGVLSFNFAVALVTGIVFGLAPALQSTRPDLAPTLKDQAGAVVGGGAVRIRKALVVAQVTLSLLLLIGAGLFIRSLKNLRDLGPGFQPSNLYAFAVDPSLNGYSLPRGLNFYQELTRNLAASAGVRQAGFAAVPILEGDEWDSTVTPEGYVSKPGEDMNPHCNAVSPRYFATLGIPILTGRDFTPKDTQFITHVEEKWKVPTVVIVNEKFAKKYFGGVQRAVGRHVGFGGDPGTPTDMEVVGVVKDVKYTGIRDEVPTQLFTPYLASDRLGGFTGYVRSPLGPDQAFSLIRADVRRLDPNLPIYDMRTIESKIDESLLTERLIASLSAVFGLLATLLAMIGLYGVMAYMVARRTREIGIRIALGALAGNVVWLVMREVLVLTAIGVALGLPIALALSRFVRSQLYGIAGNDPVTIAAATIGLAAIALLAGYIPARRATRIDPMTALRYE
ncbi:MAG: ABC transporter permease, partial [Bryobacteraceae bacterium]